MSWSEIRRDAVSSGKSCMVSDLGQVLPLAVFIEDRHSTKPWNHSQYGRSVA